MASCGKPRVNANSISNANYVATSASPLCTPHPLQMLVANSSCGDQRLSTTRRVILRYKQGWHHRHLAAAGRRLSAHRQLLDTAHETLEPHCTPSLHDLHHVELQVWEFPATCSLDALSAHLDALNHGVQQQQQQLGVVLLITIDSLVSPQLSNLSMTASCMPPPSSRMTRSSRSSGQCRSSACPTRAH